MIARQLERIHRSRLIDHLVVATSTDASDDPLVDFLEREGETVRRGSLEDVAARFDEVIKEFVPASFVRLTADCPLTDWTVIDDVIGSHVKSGADLTSNVISRTYPQGLDVECVKSSAFADFLALGPTATEREHVTLGMYGRSERYLLESVTQTEDLSKLRWTVDLPKDLEFVRRVYEGLYEKNPDFLQDDVRALLNRTPGLENTNP
jgi:spore coat polysaccharide biosynthesis protein SpsF